MNVGTGDFRILYICLLAFFLMGLVLGSIRADILGAERAAALVGDLFGSAQAGDAVGPVSKGELAIRVAAAIGRMVLVPLVLGLTLVGVLAVPLIVFLRGFAVGFASGILISQLGWRGAIATLVLMGPSQVLAVPAVLLAAGGAFRLAWAVIRRTSNPWEGRAHVLSSALLGTSPTFITAALLSAGVGILESYSLRVLVQAAGIIY